MILNSEGTEVTNPDLTLGYLVDREETIKHPAIKAKPASEKLVEKSPGLFERVVTPAVFARPAWEETRKWQEYVPYTDEELAARAAQAEADAAAKAEAEAAAAAEAEAKEQEEAIIAAMPEAVEELAEIIAEQSEQIETISLAIEELAGMNGGE